MQSWIQLVLLTASARLQLSRKSADNATNGTNGTNGTNSTENVSLMPAAEPVWQPPAEYMAACADLFSAMRKISDESPSNAHQYLSIVCGQFETGPDYLLCKLLKDRFTLHMMDTSHGNDTVVCDELSYKIADHVMYHYEHKLIPPPGEAAGANASNASGANASNGTAAALHATGVFRGSSKARLAARKKQVKLMNH
jgi:hypothetical protein